MKNRLVLLVSMLFAAMITLSGCANTTALDLTVKLADDTEKVVKAQFEDLQKYHDESKELLKQAYVAKKTLLRYSMECEDGLNDVAPAHFQKECVIEPARGQEVPKSRPTTPNTKAVALALVELFQGFKSLADIDFDKENTRRLEALTKLGASYRKLGQELAKTSDTDVADKHTESDKKLFTFFNNLTGTLLEQKRYMVLKESILHSEERILEAIGYLEEAAVILRNHTVKKAYNALDDAFIAHDEAVTDGVASDEEIKTANEAYMQRFEEFKTLVTAPNSYTAIRAAFLALVESYRSDFSDEKSFNATLEKLTELRVSYEALTKKDNE